MHKFNLKGKAAERMKGIVPETEEAARKTLSAETAENPAALRVVWRTDTGKIRKNNQDAVILGKGILGVADGMGGHKGGEIASAELRDGLIRETENRTPGEDALKEAVQTVNLALWEQQEKDASLTGMGTTLTVLWACGDKMIIGQVGDSRAYLLRNGQMKQMTNDHSMVADMVRRGVLTEEQAACHPMRNYITRAVGTDSEVETDVTTAARRHGDRWLICSDGLYGSMDRQTLETLAQAEDMDQAADALLQKALDNGGKDNISLVLIQDEGEYESEEEEKPENAEPSSPEERGVEQ